MWIKMVQEYKKKKGGGRSYRQTFCSLTAKCQTVSLKIVCYGNYMFGEGDAMDGNLAAFS